MSRADIRSFRYEQSVRLDNKFGFGRNFFFSFKILQFDLAIQSRFASRRLMPNYLCLQIKTTVQPLVSTPLLNCLLHLAIIASGELQIPFDLPLPKRYDYEELRRERMLLGRRIELIVGSTASVGLVKALPSPRFHHVQNSQNPLQNPTPNLNSDLN